MALGAENDRLLPIAESISDGSVIDWSGVRQQFDGTEEDTAVLEQLRVLDRIASLHSDRSSWGSLSILDAIGRGSFGTVYRAVDADLQRTVALKVTRPRGDGGFDAERAVREARLLARVRHPNVVTVYGAERHGEEVGVSMELISGQTLDELVRRSGPFSATEAAITGLEICRALAAVHAAGLLHGDVKAHNVMREEGGRIVLMDFGAGRDLHALPASGGDFAGTPLYVAPEVFAGEPRSRASDIYSLGVLLYYLATGTYPVEGDTRSQLDLQHRQDASRRRLRDVRPDLPEAFVQVVEKAIAEDPAERYQSVGALEAALSNAALTPPERIAPKPSLRLPITVAATVMLAGGLAGTAYWNTARPEGTSGEVAAATLAEAPATPAGSPSVVPYRVEAAVYRATGRDTAARLGPNALVAPDDRLYLELQTSVPAHVYVVNEDDQGASFLLFPLKGQESLNPLPAGRTHKLPGVHNGMEKHWRVSTPGGREHLLIFVSPERQPEIEQMLAKLPTPTDEGAVGVPLSRDAVGVLRGIGGLAPASAAIEGTAPLSRQFTTPLAATPETTTGLWVRQVELANPAQ